MDKILSTLKLSVGECGLAECGRLWNFKNMNSPFARLYQIKEGEGSAFHHGELFNLVPGYLYIIPAHTMVDLKCEDRMLQYWLHFNATVLSDIELFKICPPAYQISLDENSNIKKTAERLWQVHESSGFEEKLETDGLLRQLISYFISKSKNKQSSEHIKNFLRFTKPLDYIERNLSKQISLKELAGTMHLEPKYFSNLFCKHMGYPPIQYINRKRIEKARNMLLRKNKTLEEIAAETGFKNVFYFSKTFKKYSAVSPSEYRKQKELNIT